MHLTQEERDELFKELEGATHSSDSQAPAAIAARFTLSVAKMRLTILDRQRSDRVETLETSRPPSTAVSLLQLVGTGFTLSLEQRNLPRPGFSVSVNLKDLQMSGCSSADQQVVLLGTKPFRKPAGANEPAGGDCFALQFDQHHPTCSRDVRLALTLAPLEMDFDLRWLERVATTLVPILAVPSSPQSLNVPNDQVPSLPLLDPSQPHSKPPGWGSDLASSLELAVVVNAPLLILRNNSALPPNEQHFVVVDLGLLRAETTHSTLTSAVLHDALNTEEPSVEARSSSPFSDTFETPPTTPTAQSPRVSRGDAPLVTPPSPSAQLLDRLNAVESTSKLADEVHHIAVSNFQVLAGYGSDWRAQLGQVHSPLHMIDPLTVSLTLHRHLGQTRSATTALLALDGRLDMVQVRLSRGRLQAAMSCGQAVGQAVGAIVAALPASPPPSPRSEHHRVDLASSFVFGSAAFDSAASHVGNDTLLAANALSPDRVSHSSSSDELPFTTGLQRYFEGTFELAALQVLLSADDPLAIARISNMRARCTVESSGEAVDLTVETASLEDLMIGAASEHATIVEMTSPTETDDVAFFRVVYSHLKE